MTRRSDDPAHIQPPARIRFRAADRFGWAVFDPDATVLSVEHPSADVRAAVRRHFEGRTTFITPRKPPPHLAGVLDYCDEEQGTGLDSLDFFLRRANELGAGLIEMSPDAMVLWQESELPDEEAD